MEFSRLLFKTSKEDPKDSLLVSHKYLVRGSFVMQVGSGIYDYLPLGKRVLDKVSSIIKEELNRAGAQEVSLGFVTPATLWQKSGRFERYGKELLRFKDRKDQEFVLGPTHEEMMVELAKAYIKSYKELPKNLYQINLKFRDEMRPRFGLLRCREFMMKDGYSFHASFEDMQREFALMEKTYSRIFERMGLDFRVVEADSGAIGGEGSREFMVLASSGEDDILMCDSCRYAANIEVAKGIVDTGLLEVPEANLNRFHTPNIRTIDELSSFFKVHPYFTLKAVAKKAIYDEGERLVLFFIRGSDSLQEVKALNACKANELTDLSDKEIEDLKLPIGFVGPYDNDDILQIFDLGCKDGEGLICGANEIDYHYVGVSLREYSDRFIFADIREAREGEGCPACQKGRLKVTKGIEVGHIFQLGTKYSEPLEANFLDENGRSKPFVMGTYGIGVSRLLSAVIEQNHDERGAIFNKEVAPFACVVIVSNTKEEQQLKVALEIYDELKAKGIDVALDDRADRFGSKMADFELIGVPYGIIVGKKIEEGFVELVSRKNLEKSEYLADGVVSRVLELLG